MKILKHIKNLFQKKPTPNRVGLLFSCDNIRKVKGEELNGIKITMQNYVADGIMTRLISSKANQIKDDAIKKCHEVLTDGYTDEGIRRAGRVMMGATFKIKGLEELVDEMKYFGRKDKQPEPITYKPI